MGSAPAAAATDSPGEQPGGPAAGAGRRSTRSTRAARRFKVDPLIALFGAVVVLVAVVRPFVAEPFFVPTESMSPTLQPGDHVLAWKLAYRFGDVGRGDVAVLTDPEGGGDALIKRVVGLPGDTIEVRDGVLHVNGIARVDPYVDYAMLESIYFGPVAVPDGQVFVMGDDRSNSRDARDFGPVPEGDLEGKIVAGLWPFDRIGGPPANPVLAAD